MKTKLSPQKGFTLIEIMVVVGIIGLLTAVAVPNLIRGRIAAQKRNCINNLWQIDGAIQKFVLENHLEIGLPVTTADVTPYFGRGVSGSVEGVICPVDAAKTFDTSYKLGTTTNSPLCLIVAETHVLE